MCYLPGGSSIKRQPAPLGHGLPCPCRQHCSFAIFKGFYSTSDFGLSLLCSPLLKFGVRKLTLSLLVLPYLLPHSHKVANSSSCSVIDAGLGVAGQTSSDQFVIRAFPAPSCCQTLTQGRCSLSIGKVMSHHGASEMSVPCTNTSGQCQETPGSAAPCGNAGK